MEPTTFENAFRSIRNAQRAIAAEFRLDPETNEFEIPLPEWVQKVSAELHAAKETLINALDPDLSQPHGWWERF